MARPKDERGVAAVEFALIVPVFMLMMLGTIEFGYAYFVQASVANAARVGVRNYTINFAAPGASDNAIALAKSLVPEPDAVTDATITPPCVSAGTQTTLVMTYRYHSMTGLLDPFVGGNITVAGKGSMQCAA